MNLYPTGACLRGLTTPTLLALCMMAGACSTTPESTRDSAANSSEPGLGAAYAPARVATPTLYDELGGAAGVEQLTTDFIREIAADDRIRGRYSKTDIGRFHRMMQQQMCANTGGGCTYEGDDMQRTHDGMNIDKVEFNAVVEALMRAMDKNDVPQGTQNQLLAKYAPMRKDIIER